MKYIKAEFFNELEVVLLFFGFLECSKDSNINILKLSELDFLVMRTWRSGVGAGFLYESYLINSNPCNPVPIFSQTV
jgi:hypothetical protein